jgi:hypothetical protein
MAIKKKTKAKAKTKKTKKKTSARKTAPKKASRRSGPKKAAAKKSAVKAKKPKAAVTRSARQTAQPAAPTPPAGERIGIVTHYYNHLSVAIIKLESGVLREGETVQIKGHTTDFMQPVESMEVDHVHVSEVGPGQSIGLRVKDHAREHDVVYKVAH